MVARTFSRAGRSGALAAAAAALTFLFAAPVASASENALFTAKVDNTLTTSILSSQGAVALAEGVPEVFHTFGSQAAKYPAGFVTVPGPFMGPGGFDVIVIAATAHMFSPQFAQFTFQVKNGTTNQIITESPMGVTVHVDDIPLDTASPSDPLSDHCDGDPFFGDPFYSAVEFQITLAPPVNAVMVGPTDDLQLILTPVHLSGPIELCVEHSTFFTAMSLVVDPIPSPPVAHDDSATTSKNTPVTIDVLANDDDADGDPLTVTNLGTGAHGTTALNPDGTVTYTPDAGFLGTDTFTYTANDGTDDSNVATVTVQVINTPPVSLDDTASTFKNTAVTINVLANDSDADGDALSVTNLTQPLNGTAVLNADGTVTYTPDTGFSGFDTFTYTANDGTDDGNIALVTVEVINRPPDCSAVSPTVATLWSPNHDFAAVNVLGVTDPDGDATTITIDSIRQDEPTGVNAPDGTGVGTSTAHVRSERLGGGDGRVYHIGFTADDGDGGTCSSTVLVAVPHDQGQGSTAVDGGALFDSTS